MIDDLLYDCHAESLVTRLLADGANWRANAGACCLTEAGSFFGTDMIYGATIKQKSLK